MTYGFSVSIALEALLMVIFPGVTEISSKNSMVLGDFLESDTTVTCFPVFKGKDRFLRELQLANKMSNPNK
jgi:hypothetical protein